MTGMLKTESNATFFYYQGNVHYEFAPEDQVNKTFIWRF
jgi:hypothetical protein